MHQNTLQLFQGASAPLPMPAGAPYSARSLSCSI